MSSIILINNKKIPSDTPCIQAFDRGYTLGHGLFETILSVGGMLPFFDYHWMRLATSCHELSLKMPFDKHGLKAMIHDLLLENDLEKSKASIRLTLTDGVYPRGLLSDGNQLPTFTITVAALPDISSQPFSATIVKTRRNENSMSSRIKSISFLDNILAKQEAVAKGFDEAFLLNSKSFLAEGALSNVFIVKDGIIYTPKIEDGALPGVMRQVILKELDEPKMVEKTIETSFLFNADEIFITNALMGVKPIHQLDDKIFNNFQMAQMISTRLNERLFMCRP